MTQRPLQDAPILTTLMKMTDRLALGAREFGSSLVTLAAVALRSRHVRRRNGGNAGVKPLLILGNGPSLNDTLATQRDAMTAYDLLAVNFAANAPVFAELRPRHYVLADPHFFQRDSDPNVSRLWEALDSVTSPMTLHLPSEECRGGNAVKWVKNGDNRTLAPFNMTAADGFPSLQRFLMDRGLAMPRPRNVLIPSIMAGIRSGYRRIVIVGADHTWTRTLSVDNDNRVVSIQPHFYADNNSERQRVAAVYGNVRIHEVLGSMAVAFRSYHQIADYAARRGIEIVNATPGSFIDAFPRQENL